MSVTVRRPLWDHLFGDDCLLGTHTEAMQLAIKRARERGVRQVVLTAPRLNRYLASGRTERGATYWLIQDVR